MSVAELLARGVAAEAVRASVAELAETDRVYFNMYNVIGIEC